MYGHRSQRYNFLGSENSALFSNRSEVSVFPRRAEAGSGWSEGKRAAAARSAGIDGRRVRLGMDWAVSRLGLGWR